MADCKSTGALYPALREHPLAFAAQQCLLLRPVYSTPFHLGCPFQDTLYLRKLRRSLLPFPAQHGSGKSLRPLRNGRRKYVFPRPCTRQQAIEHGLPISYGRYEGSRAT